MASEFSPTVYRPLRDNGAVKTAPFLGNWKLGNYVRGFGWHTGEDYAYPRKDGGLGEPVFAAADGVVVEASDPLSLVGFGNLVMIQHPQLGVWTRYAHLQHRFVRAGETVRAGQLIGQMGSTGTRKTHLHFDVPDQPLPHARWWPGPSDSLNARQEVLSRFVEPSRWLYEHGALTPSLAKQAVTA